MLMLMVHLKNDGRHSFLRASRSGNLQKVIEHLSAGISVKTCDGNGLNALHLASKEGHLNVVQELLNRRCEVDARTKKGNTALHIACLAGRLDVARKLLESGANIDAQSQNGFTPLYMAAQENHVEVVKLLLGRNANQTLATDDGFTPLAVALQQCHDQVVSLLLENDSRSKVRLPALHIAAKKDNVKAAQLLLQQSEGSVDQQSASGFTPLHIAAHYGSVNVAATLIDHGADANYQAKNNITPLHVASKWGKTTMVNLLINSDAVVDCKTRDGLTPLHCATRSGYEHVTDALLQAGANFSAKTRNGLSPLHMAAQGDHVETTRVLLAAGANVDETTVDFLTPLHVAAHCGNHRVAKLFLDWKCEVNARALNGFTPLHIACKKNWIKVIELLLKFGALVEATTESGLTPLHVAAFMGHMNIVVLLMQHGANINASTMRGETPLHLATRSGQLEIVRLLLRNKPTVDAKARENQTPLHIASRLGNVDIAGVLLQHGANPENVTKDNYNCLHIAAKEGHEEVMAQLLEHGASVDSLTKKGFTPLHIASKYGRMPVARLLLSKNANPNAQGQNGLTPLHLACHYNNPQAALMLLEKGGNPHVVAKNGYTPLHIAAKKNEMDIAVNLLEYGAEANAESRNGFTPLHLASQEGHTDMISLLLQHGADSNSTAKNGLTPMHLAAQEDRVPVAEILVQQKARVDPATKAGYTPLHTACHFGQANMIRFLLREKAPVNVQTLTGYTPLHLAAQQGHLQVVRQLLDAGCDPNLENENGWTAAHIARRQHYLNIFEVLRKVTTVVESWEEIEEEIMTTVVKPAQPDTLQEHAFSESEDEGGDNDFTTIPSSPLFARHTDVYRPHYEGVTGSRRSVNDRLSMASGEDSIHENLVSLDSTDLNAALRHGEVEDEMQMQRHSGLFAELPPKPELNFAPDNVPIQRKPVKSGKENDAKSVALSFLVSFMVDARGGSLSCSRHQGLRLAIPPGAASGPVRVICRLLRQDKVPRPPPLNDGEGLACRIMEMGPNHIKFNSPIMLEVPHHAALRGREREVVVLRSENGEVWKEHPINCNDQEVAEAMGDGSEKLESTEELAAKRIVRILTTDFPQYFALLTRVRQDIRQVGPDGGVMSSTVVPQVQAVFPDNALMKRIRVGLQAQVIPPEIVAKLLGNRVAVSPIVTIEPRRRQFHKPITLTIPSPQPTAKGMINPPGGQESRENNLRLLCSITGGSSPATWEDITGSMPLSVVQDCVSFTTKLSARFWLIHCQNVQEVTEMGAMLYREACLVPYIGKFVLFARRHDPEEAQLRAFCLTDDKVDKTLECHEGFELKAASPEVEVLQDRPVWLETAGNLVPVTKTGMQLQMPFMPFVENRLPFLVRVKDPHQDPLGKVAFMKDSRLAVAGGTSPGGDAPAQRPLCTLEVRLSDEIAPGIRGKLDSSADQTRMISTTDLDKWKTMMIETETIAKSELNLREVAEALGCDWSLLARELDIAQSDITQFKLDYRTDLERAFAMLILWRKQEGDKATGNALERGLRRIAREDVVKVCMKNIQYVTEEEERTEAAARIGDKVTSSPERDELLQAVDELLTADVDSRRGVFHAPDPEEDAEASRAKTEAYLSLIDQLDACLPSEEEMLKDTGIDERDGEGGEAVEEESVAAHQKDLQSAPDLSPLLERLSVQPAHAMAPENEHEEEEDDEGSVIKPTKMKVVHAARDFNDSPSIYKASEAEPAGETPITSREADTLHAEVAAPKEETLKLQETDLDFEVDEDFQEMSKKRNLHAAAPMRPATEPQEAEEALYVPTQQKFQHSHGPDKSVEAPKETEKDLGVPIQLQLQQSHGPGKTTEAPQEVEEDLNIPSQRKLQHSQGPGRSPNEPQEVDEDLNVPSQRKLQHSEGPRLPTEEQGIDESLDIATQRKLLHSEGPLHQVGEIEPDDGFNDSREVTPRGRTLSLSSDDSFVDAEEKRGISQEPDYILDPPATAFLPERTSDLESSQYDPSTTQSDVSSSMTMTVSGISRFEEPLPEKEALQKDSSEDEEAAFDRAYEEALKQQQSSSDEDHAHHHHHDLKETHQISYDKPEEHQEVKEIQEVLDDGTIVIRRVTLTRVTQRVTDRVTREGCPEALAAALEADEAALRGPDVEESEPVVEEYEETLPDGSVVKRRVEQSVTEAFYREGEPGLGSSVGEPHLVAEEREFLPDGSVVVRRTLRQCDVEGDEGQTTSLDEPEPDQ